MTILKIKVQPGAGRNEICGMWQEMVKVKVYAQAESGKANKACIELISDKFGISKNKIKIIKGHTSREKQVQIIGLSDNELLGQLDKILQEGNEKN
jgi:uncharacterized protein (TIGR00251 family)